MTMILTLNDADKAVLDKKYDGMKRKMPKRKLKRTVKNIHDYDATNGFHEFLSSDPMVGNEVDDDVVDDASQIDSTVNTTASSRLEDKDAEYTAPGSILFSNYILRPKLCSDILERIAEQNASDDLLGESVVAGDAYQLIKCSICLRASLEEVVVPHCVSAHESSEVMEGAMLLLDNAIQLQKGHVYNVGDSVKAKWDDGDSIKWYSGKVAEPADSDEIVIAYKHDGQVESTPLIDVRPLLSENDPDIAWEKLRS